jgi:SAM-dependent methyltransferase
VSGTRARAFYERYQVISQVATQQVRSEERDLRRFISTFDLEMRRVLEIGSSQAAFQHLVSGWVGIDLAVAAGLHAVRPFAAASAEALPFRDATFDAAWSIAVLEHVPNPERALDELNRVLKPGGAAYLAPAWHCRPWAAEGLHLRAFTDLTWRQRLVKFFVPFRELLLFRALCALPLRVTRELRYLVARSRPTRLHFGRLRPNYETFWCADVDACSVLDPHDTLLFFLSRGWISPSHPDLAARLLARHGAIVVRKP